MERIIDSHCHAWSYWPYQPPVPDPEQRGRIEQLLHEMDINKIDQALLVSAQIEHNPDNNSYIAAQVKRYPDRLYQLVDLDSKWSTTYHQPGGGQRLRQMADQWIIKGFTHYLHEEEDGSWLYGSEGQSIFQAAADLNLFASLSCLPHQQSAVRKIARIFPQVPILCHHMGFVRSGKKENRENLKEILSSSENPNIYIKISGFAYAAEESWNFPFQEVQWIAAAIYDQFGPQRLCWGSDYPVVRFFMTYRQSIEVFRTFCDFVPDQDKAWILGRTLQGMLKSAGKTTI
jgi:predicted TIM-barrel fold metal-dependent hydrolase